MLNKIDHIGIAVKSLEASIKFYEEVLGFKCEGIEEIPSQKVRTAFFSVGGVHLELLEPTSEESTIAKYITNHGEGFHHLAFLSDNLPEQIDNSRKKNCRMINEIPVPGAHGKEVAFMHPKSSNGLLIEFCSNH